MNDIQYTAPQDAGSTIAIIYMFINSSGYNTYNFVLVPSTLNIAQQDLYNAAVANAASFATANSLTLTGYVSGWYPDIASATKPGVISASTASSLAAILAAIQPQSYQAILSQSGSLAPTSGITPVNTYSGAPTFTLARTSAGVYTVTASTSVFNTSGKTGVFVSPPNNPLANIVCAVTSSTVITITTSINNLTSLLGLGFTATPTDGILSKSMIYIQTYP